MSKHPPLKVLLGSELWDEALVAGLTRLGHTVTILPTDDPDLCIISRRAWRVPKDISNDKVSDHVEMICKQIRLLQHEDQTPRQQPEGSAEQGPPAKGRKRAPKKKPAGPASSVPADAAAEQPPTE